MEKVMRALAETENNAAAIRALQKKMDGFDVKNALDALELKVAELEKQNKCLCIRGTYTTEGALFGKFKSGGNVLAVVRFDSSTTTATMWFCGNSVHVGTTNPIACILPAGEGSLYMKPYSSNCVCLLYGDVTKI